MVEHSPTADARPRRCLARMVSSAIAVTAVALAVGALAVGSLAAAPTARAATLAAAAESPAHHGSGGPGSSSRSAPTSTVPTVSVATAPAPAATPAAAPGPAEPPATAPVATTTPPTAPSPTIPAPVASGPAASTGAEVAALVIQVEGTGIAPGPTWTWSIGDTSGCGAVPGTNAGTGCTSGAAGSATTVLAGAPGLLLVAHELANAETENYAVPALMALVARAAAGTSWSAIDAVASCLVVHFMHVQDGAAGSWTCPVALADVVGAHIHDANFTG